MLITENILPHLNYFWHVAKYLSFTKAGLALKISQSAVSLQVKTLEDKLQTQLILRQTKNKISLTPVGETLFKRCSIIFQEVESALQEINPKHIKGSLVVSCAVNFGSVILVPFLKILEKKHPLLSVELKLTDSLSNFNLGQTDLAIRWGKKTDPSLQYECFVHEKYIVVASSQYLKKSPTIKTPKDLEKHTVIMRKKIARDWESWLNTLPKSEQPKFNKIRIIDNTFGIIEALKEDMGVSLLPAYAIQNLIKEKKLKPVLPKHQDKTWPIYACYIKSPFEQPKIRVFIETLQEYLKEKYGSLFLRVH